MKSYINQPRPKTENRPFFFFQFGRTKLIEDAKHSSTIKTVFLDCWKASISLSHIILFFLKNNNFFVKNDSFLLYLSNGENYKR